MKPKEKENTKQNSQDHGKDHQEMKDSDAWNTGNEQDKPYNCPSLLPQESFQIAAQGRGTQVETKRLSESEWKETAESLGRPRWLEFKKQNRKQKRAAQRKNFGDQRESPLIFNSVLISACLWGSYSMLKKEPPSKNRNKSAWCAKGLETVCSHQHVRKAS